MQRDKAKIYTIEILLFISIFIALIVSNKMTYVVSSIILTIFSIIVLMSLKKKGELSLYKNQTTMLMIAFAIIYVAGFYCIGMYINDFTKQAVRFSTNTLMKFIIPLSVSIITSELMRHRLISQDGKIRFSQHEFDISKFLTFLNMVLVDMMIYIGLYDLTNYNEFLAAIGFVLFASVSCNLLYNYVSKRYGVAGIIFYRLITALYAYIIPITPNIYIYIKSFFRMIYPYIMYLVLEKTFSKTDFVVSYSDRKKNFVSITLMLIIMTLITMLISCQFKYGVLVIGSKSMTGSINMGDAVVYKSYNNEAIEEGQVIIFESNGLRLVHRVIKIMDVNGEVRYYTKGDANDKMDEGYIVKDDIIGVTKARLIAIGYPTIWFRQLFS